LLPTRIGEGCVVGLRFAGKTVLAEDKSYWEAYHRLMRKVVDDLP